MSIKAMNWAWEQPISGNEKLCLMALADAATDHGYSFPSYATVARKCHIDRSTVIRTVGRLALSGYLRVDARQRGNGSATSNSFQLHMYGAFCKVVGSGKTPPPNDVAGSGKTPLGGGSKTPLAPQWQNATRVVARVPPPEPPLNSLSSGGHEISDEQGGASDHLFTPPSDFKPSETTLTRLRMNGHAEPTGDLILKFVSHYEAQPAARPVSDWQAKFVTWAVREKNYSTTNGASHAASSGNGRGRNANSPAGAAAAMSDFLQS